MSCYNNGRITPPMSCGVGSLWGWHLTILCVVGDAAVRAKGVVATVLDAIVAKDETLLFFGHFFLHNKMTSSKLCHQYSSFLVKPT